jgi:ACT domain-containing protein
VEKTTFTQIPLDELQEIIRDCMRIELEKILSKQIGDTISDDLIKVEDAIHLFKVSKVTLYKWRKKGVLPFYRISSRIYYKRSELLEALKSSRKRNNKLNYSTDV